MRACWYRIKSELIKDLEKDLETLSKWLSDYGLKVNKKLNCSPVLQERLQKVDYHA
jgi:hypothetical protein